MTAKPGTIQVEKADTIQVEKPGTIQVEKQVVEQKREVKRAGGSGDAVYGMGMVGAWVYYIGRAGTWGERGVGFLKGLVWPAFLVYEALKFLEKK